MGATNFSTIGHGRTPQEAYDAACREALDYYGHQEGYNGTITTTSGFQVVTLEQAKAGTKHTAAAHDRWTRLAWGGEDGTNPAGVPAPAEKWHECWCLELPRKYAKGQPRGVRAYLFAGWAAE